MDKSFTQTYFDFSSVDWSKVQTATYETIYMTVISILFVFVIGMALGILLYSLGRQNTIVYRILYTIVSIISNIFRSIPFMVLIILIFPITKMLVGTMLGVKAGIPALVLSAAPFFARLVEIALREVDSGVLEAANAMGASRIQIMQKILVPESLPALISGFTVTTVSMVGFTAMAGFIGAGGLGALAWNDGYQLGNYTMTLVATIIILIIVFIIQGIGDTVAKRVDKR